MKVMFIYSTDDVQSVQTPLRSWSSIQFGISYISSMLKSHGHKTKLLVLGSNQLKVSTKLLRTSIEEFVPRLVCFTAVYSQYAFIEKIASLIEITELLTKRCIKIEKNAIEGISALNKRIAELENKD